VVRQVSEQGGVRKLDIDVCDEQGRVCVGMRGFSTRGVQAGGASSSEQQGTLLLQPQWQQSPAQVQVQAYSRHDVLLCEVGDVGAGELQPLLGHATCHGWTASAADVAQRYKQHARQLFEHVQAILKGKPAGPVLLQVVVPSLGEAQVHAGLSGLLRTARQELNPGSAGKNWPSS